MIQTKTRTALLSVYNKTGIVDFARELTLLNFTIFASGGTAKILSESGVPVTDVATLVGGGAILGHRVVTLSREIHAGLLACDTEEDRKELEKLKIPFIDLVCVDLYPLEQQISELVNQQISKEAKRDAVLEKTDIGGPTMLRSAAKGRRVVICDFEDRKRVVDWLKNDEPDREKFISLLAAKAEMIMADYCLTSARYHGMGKIDGLIFSDFVESKYGENAWQVPAGLYSSFSPDALALPNFKLLAGTEPSYNNWCDVDRLLQTMTHITAGFDINFNQVTKIAVGVKHGNPCGASVSESPILAIQKMLEGDLRAIFGGLVMLNFEVDDKLAEVLVTHRMKTGRRLLDGIVAPAFTASAVDLLKRKGDKCRFLVNPALAGLSKSSLDNHSRLRYVRGGFLKQPNYNFVLDFKNEDLQTSGELFEEQKKDILLAWAVGSTSNSNTVSIVKNQMLIGNGVGQQDRVSCCELALKRAGTAGHDLQDSVAYSDSFFPFVDGPKILADAGIKIIFATRGSVKDGEIKKVCVDNNVLFVTLPDTKARGFFGH